jgi:glycosyltransferase involved in cell wall biosynthesis
VAAVNDAAGEVVEDGQTGFLIRQDDRAALTDRLIRLLTDEPLRRQMGDAGLRLVRERFSYERFARTMLSLMDDAGAAPVRHEHGHADGQPLRSRVGGLEAER